MFHWLEKRPFFLGILIFLSVSFAGIVTILPSFADIARPTVGTKPYTVLELAGRGVYIKDSCNACHSQMVRPFKSETDRYGIYSLSGEYAYDRPSLWGSKRTGPDLLRVGNYRTTDWHENHMLNPTSVVPDSLMPKYPHMFKNLANIDTAWAEAETVRKVFSVPYNEPLIQKDGTYQSVKLASTIEEARTDALAEAKLVVADMKTKSVIDAVERGEIPEIVALIAYMNSLK